MCPISSTAGVGAARVGIEGRRRGDLDATRAFALLLGVVFHASLSFVPVYMGWAVQDVSTGAAVTAFTTISHSFRMELFFLLAGFLGRASCARSGAFRFVTSRLLRIGLPWFVGWFVVRPLLVSGWVMGGASLRGDVDVAAGLWAGIASLGAGWQGWWTGTHLWFLYYLLQVVILMGWAHWLMERNGGRAQDFLARVDRALVRWGGGAWTPVFLAVPTALVLLGMQTWGVDTPDRSLVPHGPALLMYLACFSLGWLLRRQEGLIEQWSRISAPRLIGAVLGVAVVLVLGRFERDPAHPWWGWIRAIHALGYGVMMWSLVFLTLGVFQSWSIGIGTGGGVRYVAEASYWIYLVHLPLVVWLQVAVSEWPGHWSLKLAGISVVTVGLALVSYDLLVRSTFLGAWLNGRRRARVILPWVGNVLRTTAPSVPPATRG